MADPGGCPSIRRARNRLRQAAARAGPADSHMTPRAPPSIAAPRRPGSFGTREDRHPDRPLSRAADPRAAGRHALPRGDAAACSTRCCGCSISWSARAGRSAIVWRMLANLIPEYLGARHPARADARHPARLPQARSVLRARQRCARSGSATGGCCACPISIAVALLALNFAIVGFVQPLRPLCLSAAALRAALGRARRLDQGRRVHQSRPADDPAGRAQRERGTDSARRLRRAPRRATAGRIAVTADRGTFLATDDPDTILLPARPTAGWSTTRPSYRAPRVLSFVQHDLPIDLPAIERVPRPRRRHQGADHPRAVPARRRRRRCRRRGATRPAPISISGWSRW